jgi:hypothetical protein
MTDQPLIERKETAVSDKFRQMADRIDHNAQSGFGGACVLVLPDQNRRTIEILVLDSTADVGQFLGAVSARIKLVAEELDAAQKQNQAFGRR